MPSLVSINRPYPIYAQPSGGALPGGVVPVGTGSTIPLGGGAPLSGGSPGISSSANSPLANSPVVKDGTIIPSGGSTSQGKVTLTATKSTAAVPTHKLSLPLLAVVFVIGIVALREA